MKAQRGNQLRKAVMVLEFISAPAWRTYKDLEELLGCCNKTARRWVSALEEVYVPLEFTEDNRRFRRMR